MRNNENFQPRRPVVLEGVATKTGVNISDSAITYLKQVYLLLTASLILAVAAGFVGMSSPFAYEHPIILIVMQFAALFIAFKFQNPATLYLFTGLSGFALGPLIAIYINAGMSAIVGQAAFMTAAAFGGLSVYAMTTKKDFSRMGGMLMAGVIVLIVGSLINMFMESTAIAFAISSVGAVIFSAFILYDTQRLKEMPWAVSPSLGALSLYINILNLFIMLLQLLGIMGGDD